MRFFDWLSKYFVELFCRIHFLPPTAKKEGTGRKVEVVEFVI